MNFKAAACALVPLLLASGCVIKSDPLEATPASMASIPDGTWLIDEAVATDQPPPGAKPPLGLTLSFGLTGAGDAGGRRCINPKYQAGEAPLGDVIGGRGEAMSLTVPAIAIDCNGRPFAVYATMADGIMLTRHGPWVLHLTRIDPPAPSLVLRRDEPEQTASAPQPQAPKVKLHPAWTPDPQPTSQPPAAQPVRTPQLAPAPSAPAPVLAAPEPQPQPVAAAKSEPPPPQPVPALAIDLTTFLTAPAPRAEEPAKTPEQAEPTSSAAATGARLVYLASYTNEDRARLGWKVLSQRAPTLGQHQPVLSTVLLPDKGRFIRLFTTARDETDAKRICADIGSALVDCGAAGRD